MHTHSLALYSPDSIYNIHTLTHTRPTRNGDSLRRPFPNGSSTYKRVFARYGAHQVRHLRTIFAPLGDDVGSHVSVSHLRCVQSAGERANVVNVEPNGHPSLWT